LEAVNLSLEEAARHLTELAKRRAGTPSPVQLAPSLSHVRGAVVEMKRLRRQIGVEPPWTPAGHRAANPHWCINAGWHAGRRAKNVALGQLLGRGGL